MGTIRNRRFAVVTGGSSGIGFELEKQMIEHDGLDVDLATPDGVDELVREVLALARPIDALVLNAGVGGAKSLVPQMVARGSGHVLITSSIAGTMPAPYEAVYGATKAFDLSFAEGLRDELRDTGVTVTALQPGPTDTQFFERAGLEDTKVGAGNKDDPAVVAKQGFDAMTRGDDKVYAGELGTRLEGLASEILPEPAKARAHRKQAEPGSGHKK